MAPSTTPSRHAMTERKHTPSPLKMTSAMRAEKTPASPARSVLEVDPENPEVVTPRRPKSGSHESRPRVRSGGTARNAVQSGHSSLQSPDVAGLEQLRQTMQATLGVLGSTFDYLGEQTARVAALGPAVDASHQIHQLRRQVHAQDRKQEERMQEIKSLLQDVLKEQIAEHLRAHVFEMIREKVEEYVSHKVKDALAQQIPDKLRQQVREHRKHLAEVKRCLHNSESRRANATLRNHGSAIREPLHELLMLDGTASDLWPCDLAQLFGYSNDTAKRLLDDYELTYANDDPTERMLNKFMAHIGVGFQMVPPQRRAPMQIAQGHM